MVSHHVQVHCRLNMEVSFAALSHFHSIPERHLPLNAMTELYRDKWKSTRNDRFTPVKLRRIRI